MSVQQDPMETEANPQPPVHDSGPAAGAPSGGTSGGASSGGGSSSSSGGGASSSGGGGSSRMTVPRAEAHGGLRWWWRHFGSEDRALHAQPQSRRGAVYLLRRRLHGPAAPGCGRRRVCVELSRSANTCSIVPVQVQFRPSQGTLNAPVGIQYDIGLPVPNLYIYPRVSIGYAVALAGAAGSVIADHFGVAIPEVGIKYVFSGRYHLGGELVSIPVLFNSNTVVVHYRVALSFGVGF